jgi:hypothetical protein
LNQRPDVRRSEVVKSPVPYERSSLPSLSLNLVVSNEEEIR